MPKIKECRWCGEILFCKACGRRWTPDYKRGNSRSAQVRIDPELKKRLQQEAEAAGVSLAEYVEQQLDENDE